LKQRIGIMKEELISKALHPSRIAHWLEQGVSIDEL